MRLALVVVALLLAGCAEHTVDVKPPVARRCHAVIDGIACPETGMVPTTWCQCVGDV